MYANCGWRGPSIPHQAHEQLSDLGYQSSNIYFIQWATTYYNDSLSSL